ncbi:MAG TPA: ATP-binding protein [Burkholderiales bacterium]|nr:ATP-binding protein [Burkholderiales bacterium]
MSWDRVQENWKKVSGTTKEALDSLARSGHGVLQGANLTPQRIRTDDSLRVEREKADHAVAARQEKVATHADAVVDHARDNADAVLSVARDNADAVLDAARDKADKLLESGERHGNPAAEILVEERELADETLRDERDDADETLRRERDDYARTLRKFLPLERESTDRFLRSERMHSDGALVNRDDFLAIVTHDLRDLLGGIVVSAALIPKSAPASEAGKSILVEAQRIQRYAARMTRLIGDLTDVASIDAGKLAIAPALRDLASLIGEAEDAFKVTASAKGISVETQISAQPLMAWLDYDRILQVLANLISNSLRFTPEGGRIVIIGEQDEANVRLSVADTGSGIPDGALDSIFERFSQAGDKDRRGRLGLGLYISRCIVEAHGGRIWAQSAPRAGTKILLTLPARGP